MIIRKVRLAPFGAVADKSYAFDRGLNILLGPNEAGKSTLINAIYAVLFIPAHVRKSSEDWKSFLQNCLPYPSGDTARVEIEFETIYSEIVSYRCAWGGAREEKMFLPDGSEINDPGEARRRLQDQLRFGAGTYKGILFARQEEINRTFERLKDNREALATVSDLLRSALHESGGVSLAELETKINQEYDHLMQNWDPDLDGPRGGRDINNPHKKNVGAILSAYYRREGLRRRLRDTQALEAKITVLTKELAEKKKELDSASGRLTEMEALEEDARQRASLEPKLDSIREKEAGLKGVISEWPRTEEKVEGLAREIKEGKHRQEALQEELEAAEKIIETRRKRELLQQAGPLQEEIKNKEAERQKLPPVGKDELKFLEQKHRERERLKELAEAMKIKASFRAKRPLELTVTSGLEESRKVEVARELFLEGSGRLIIEGEEWAINIQAGDEDVEDLIEQAEKAARDFNEKLEELSLDDLEQARETAARREELEKKIEANRLKLESSLGRFTIEELEKAVEETGTEINVRDPEQVKADIEEVRFTLNSSNYRQEQEQEKLQKWEEKYGSHDQALDELAGLRQQAVEIKKKLEGLAPLPAEFTSADQFIDSLKRMRSQNQQIKERIFDLKAELAELKSRMPEESTEELQVGFEQADEHLAKLKLQGRAIAQVKEEFYDLKAELDSDTYAPLKDAFARYLSLATNYRYHLGDLEGALPLSVTAAEGKTLPVHLLSAGTASGAALSLRLAMAEYLLQEAGGFLIMDDPLVNLDPDRKQSAARAVQDFAQAKQTLIATCDPQTAELFQGKLVSV